MGMLKCKNCGWKLESKTTYVFDSVCLLKHDRDGTCCPTCNSYLHFEFEIDPNIKADLEKSPIEPGAVISSDKPHHPKPPTGVMPEYLYKEERLNQLANGIHQYITTGNYCGKRAATVRLWCDELLRRLKEFEDKIGWDGIANPKIWVVKFVAGNPEKYTHIRPENPKPQLRSEAMTDAIKISANGWRCWIEHVNDPSRRIYESEVEVQYQQRNSSNAKSKSTNS